MGEGQSKQSRSSSKTRAMPTKTSVATGDIKSEDLTSLQNRCIPKGLRIDGSIHLPENPPVAAPVAAPTAAPIAPPGPNVAHDHAKPVAPNGFYGVPPAPFLAGPANLPRSSSMVVTAPQGQPVVVAQPGAPVLVRTDSMVRTQQQGVVVPVPVQRSSSMVRTSAQQQVLLTPANAPGALPRSSSMVRTQAPADMQSGSRSVLVSPGVAMPTTSAPSLIPDALLGSRTMIPTTQAPSLIPASMQPEAAKVMPTTNAPSLIPASMQPTTNAPSMIPASMQPVAPPPEVLQQVPFSLRMPQVVAPAAPLPSSVQVAPMLGGFRHRSPPPEPIRAASLHIGMPPSAVRAGRSPGPSMRGKPPPQMRASEVYERMCRKA